MDNNTVVMPEDNMTNAVKVVTHDSLTLNENCYQVNLVKVEPQDVDNPIGELTESVQTYDVQVNTVKIYANDTTHMSITMTDGDIHGTVIAAEPQDKVSLIYACPRQWRLDEGKEDYVINVIKQEPQEKGESSNPPNTVDNEVGDTVSQCGVCKKVFPTQVKLVIHQRLVKHSTGAQDDSPTKHKLALNSRTHSQQKAHACKECGQSFTNSSDLKKHIFIHSEERLYNCDECGKCFTRKEHLTRHIRTHTGERPYSCSECSKCFTRKWYLKAHMRTHSEEQPYKCTVCGKCFQQTTGLKIHMITHTDNKPYVCTQCGKHFTANKYLKEHIMSHSGKIPQKCNECGKCFTQKSYLKNHMRTHTAERPYVCLECDKCFHHKISLKQHMNIHSVENDNRCGQCGKAFSFSGNLIVHMRTHTGERPYKCSHCGKCFSHTNSLRIHMKLNHCKKPEFSVSGTAHDLQEFEINLKAHMSHSGENPHDHPHNCGECGKHFTHLGHLNRHMLIHTGERPHTCVECGKSFTQKQSLQRHMITHTAERPYSCDECEKSFKLKRSLHYHMRTHTGERPYSCTECSKSFAHSSSFKTHMRTHTGERPYSCTQCDKYFTHLTSVRRHMRSFCINTDQKPSQNFSTHDVVECEVKPVHVKTESNVFSMADTHAIVVKNETTDLPHNGIETTCNKPLNMNIIKVEAIVDRPSQMESEIIQIKGEDNDTQETIPDFKVEGLKEDLSFTDEFNTYL